MIFRKTPFAIRSLQDQAIYLEEHASLDVAERYLDAVEETLTLLSKNPDVSG